MRPGHCAVRNRCRSPFRHGHFDKAVTIHRLALKRKEQIALDDIARIDLDAGNHEPGGRRAASCFGQGFRAPQRERQIVVRCNRPFENSA